MSQIQFDRCVGMLPEKCREEILRYRFHKDRAQRLAGKLLLRKAIMVSGHSDELMQDISKNENNKPFIKEWLPFNISHSEDMVVLAFGGNTPMGVDIEFVKSEKETQDLHSYLSVEEQEVVSVGSARSFYNVWVRKESVLKAEGKGIVDGLNTFNSLNDPVVYNNRKWFLTELHIHKDYISYIAIDSTISKIALNEISLEN